MRVLTQSRQAANVLVEVAPRGVGQGISEQASEVGQGQGFPQRQGAVAGQYADTEQQNCARHDDPGNRQALDAGDQENRQA
ncbi:hypothetical protein D9M68_886520 [compost metagenome]